MPPRRPSTNRQTAFEDPSQNQSIYYAGPENRTVATAVQQLIAAAESPPTGWTKRANPIVLIGPPGSGKSLLAAGVAAAWRATTGDEAVLELSGADLRRRFEAALGVERKQPGAVEALKQRLAGVRLLIVEDLDGLAASPLTVAAMADILDRLNKNGGLLIATAGRPLGETDGFDARLVSRCVAGLTLEVSAPAEAARGELLRAAVEATGRQIEAEAVEQVAKSLPADARRVLAVAHRLSQRFGLRRPIGAAEARAFLGETPTADPSPPLAEIVAVVARYYALPVRQLRSSSRKAPIVLARAVAIYFARQLTPLSYDEIGKYLGGRDHTTVLHNYRRIEKGLTRDRALRSAIDDLHRRIGANGRPSA